VAALIEKPASGSSPLPEYRVGDNVRASAEEVRGKITLRYDVLVDFRSS
jgi:hypothetical protein